MDTVFILIGIDPSLQPGIHSIDRFNTKLDAYIFVQKWITNKLNRQKNGIEGLKGKGNIESHVEQYLNDFKLTNNIHYYGEYRKNIQSLPYEHKWMLFEL